MTEQQPYRVIKRIGALEIRHYPKHLLVQVAVNGDFVQAGNIGFGPLVRYISGNNLAGEKIAMTAPVIQSSESAERHTVSFVLPEGMDLSKVPMPADARVQVVEVPPRNVAAMRFSGSWRESTFDEFGDKLSDAVAEAGLQGIGEVYVARYDPPWKPGFLKRNEVLIEIESSQDFLRNN